jgi:hypothetical protein
MSSLETPLWRNYYNNKKELAWRKWLHTLVYIDFRDDSSVVKRYQAFQYFIKEGLIPFVTSHKYVFHTGIDLANDLANLLYLKPPTDFCRQSFERNVYGRTNRSIDLDYYQSFGIPKEDWDIFWKDWQWMTDFMDENFRNQYLMHDFVYNRLDLENSEVTEKITRELEEEDDFEEHYIVPEHASEAIGQGKDRNSLY